MKHILTVRQYEQWVSLGFSVEERAQLQKISIDLAVEFKLAPQTCHTDQLHDTVCYADMCAKITDILSGKAFSTIERLTQDLFNGIASLPPKGSLLRVEVKKNNPPIVNLNGGVTYQIEGLL